MRKNKLVASILSADALRIAEEVGSVADVIDEVHLDILDGHFAPPISFGAELVRHLHTQFPQVKSESHLMITNPAEQWRLFADAGSTYVTFHVEMSHRAYILLDQIRKAQCRSGIAVNPVTDTQRLTTLVGQIDRLLVMTVEPGYGGQSLIPNTLKKVEQARALFGDEIDIEVDGGINDTTILDAAHAGANVFVLGSYLFNHPPHERHGVIARLREMLDA